MPSVQQQVSKGFYQYSQINHFVSVKNFMFVRSKEQNCLLIRFSNYSDFTVNSMVFTVVQLDSAGTVLGKCKVVRDGLSFAPGTTYTSEEGIVVDERCSDFKLIFSEVCSGNYVYLVQKGKAEAYYRKAKGRIVEGMAHSKKEALFSVKPRRFGKPGLALLLAIMILVLIVLFNVYHMYSIYVEHTEAEKAAQLEQEHKTEDFGTDDVYKEVVTFVRVDEIIP